MTISHSLMQIKYLGATNTQGSRMVATYCGHRVVVPYSYDVRDMDVYAAEMLILKINKEEQKNRCTVHTLGDKFGVQASRRGGDALTFFSVDYHWGCVIPGCCIAH